MSARFSGVLTKGVVGVTTLSLATTAFGGVTFGAVTADAPGVTSSTITIGVLASLTGFAAPSFGPDVATGAEAAIKQVNAKGGIDGRKLVLDLVDDASSPTQDLTAVNSLISKNVFGIIEATPFFFGGYQAAVRAAIPVTGSANDGPEWGASANTDLFGAFGSPDTSWPTDTETGKFLKQFGVTKLASVAYGNSPSALGAAAAVAASAKLSGLPTAYQDISQNVGATNWAPDGVAIKKAGANGLVAVLGTADNIALLQTIKQEGVNLKAEFIPGGYQQAVIGSASTLAATQGIMFNSDFAPFEIKSPATKAWQAALAKYGNYTAANPTQGLAYGWFAAQTFIKGLEVAGKNPTRSSFITNLHKVTKYTANGLLAAPVNYSLSGAYDSSSAGNCWYESKVVGSAFVPVSTKPFCGSLVAGTKN